MSGLPRRQQSRRASPGQRRAAALRASRTDCAASATARSIATGARACTAGGPANGTARRATCLCVHCHSPHEPRFKPMCRGRRRRGRRDRAYRTAAMATRRSLAADQRGRRMATDEHTTDKMSRREFASVPRLRRPAGFLYRVRPAAAARDPARPAAHRQSRTGSASTPRSTARRDRLRCGTDARRAVRLRARPLALQRQPAVRRGVRGGEQPVARSAGAMDSRALDGQGQGHRLRRRRSVLRAGAGARAGTLLRADGLPALPQRALHEGLSRPARPGPSPTASS